MDKHNKTTKTEVERKEQYNFRAPRVKTLYELLDVSADASLVNIRAAYIRLKNTYSVQSQALYSLVDEDSARQSLLQIEEAFKVLNDEVLRREYDMSLRSPGEFASKPPQVPRKGLSGASATPRTLKWDQNPWEEELYEAPRPRPYMGLKDLVSIPRMHPSLKDPSEKQRVMDIFGLSEDPGDGTLLRFARESLGLSEEDVQQRTKISFEYLKALEANNYNRLPAIVYIRGFLKGYFQFLGVEDSKLLIDAYVNRMHNTLNLRESDRV